MSIAPRVDYVDPEQLSKFAQLLGFDKKPLTDLPLKDETPVSSSLVLNNPSFNSSGLRLLSGFTTLVNGGKLVTPHLLHKAYQRDKLSPFKTTLSTSDQRTVLHPDTTKDLTDFLASKWLKLGRRGKTPDTPMFFETHRFAATIKNGTQQESNEEELTGQAPYLSQSVMLGAIPGKNPKLTMIAVLSYPDSCDEVYPDALKTFGNKFSILSPDQDMIRKMLRVAAMPPPKPSPNFWDNENTMFAKSSGSIAPEQVASAVPQSDTGKNMPDVTGKSLRAGLQVLQHLNLGIKLVGSGRITSQQPPAGTELISGSECILEMQQEI